MTSIIVWILFWFNSVVSIFLFSTYLSSSGVFTMMRIIDALYPTVRDKITIMYMFIVAWVRQWIMGNVQKIGDCEYQLTHVIDGELVKINIRQILPRIIDIQDVETDESYMDKAEPYIIYKQVPWTLERNVVYCFEDGTTLNDMSV